jgi:hypothetical protein
MEGVKMLHNRRLREPKAPWPSHGLVEERKMTASVGFDIFALTSSTITKLSKVERFHKLRLAIISSRISVAISQIFHWVGERGADFIVSTIDNKAERLAQHAMFFERAKELIVEELALTASNGYEALAEKLAKFEPINAELIEQCDDSIRRLEAANAPARVGEAFARVRVIGIRLGTCVSEIKHIVAEGSSHAEVLACLSALNRSMDEKLRTYMDDDVVFDPELVALADAAIDKINTSSKAVKA